MLLTLNSLNGGLSYVKENKRSLLYDEMVCLKANQTYGYSRHKNT